MEGTHVRVAKGEDPDGLGLVLRVHRQREPARRHLAHGSRAGLHFHALFSLEAFFLISSQLGAILLQKGLSQLAALDD